MFDFTGLNILIVEDEFLVAYDVAATLTAYGAQVIGPACCLTHAIEIVEANGIIHAAILDINLAGEYVFPAADRLAERRIPFIFATGYDADIIPARHRAATRLQKPLPPETLAQALSAAVLESRSS